jgi:hypothetical protein
VRPRLLAAPARCPANPTPSSAPTLAHSSPPPPLNLDRALSLSIASPSSKNSSPELSRPARNLFPGVLPSLTLVSWLQPRQQIRRVVPFISSQLWRPRNDRSTHPLQLRRPHRREEERRRPQLTSPSGFDLPRAIFIARPRSQDTASRPRVLCPGSSVSTYAPWRWVPPVSVPPLLSR